MAKYKVLKVERDDAVARRIEAERNSQLENVQRLEHQLDETKKQTLTGLLKLAREIWSPVRSGPHAHTDRLSLEQIVVRLSVDLGKLARLARGADKDAALRTPDVLETAMGNIIFSMIRWCDDLGLDPVQCVERAVECQRKFAERNVNR